MPIPRAQNPASTELAPQNAALASAPAAIIRAQGIEKY